MVSFSVACPYFHRGVMRQFPRLLALLTVASALRLHVNTVFPRDASKVMGVLHPVGSLPQLVRRFARADRAATLRMSAALGPSEEQLSTMQSGSYDYGGFRVAFRKKAAAAGYERSPPLLLIHPVGIGIASWFWDKFLDEWVGGEIFVPELIGCGASDKWDPSESGLSMPLDWVRSLETLWQAEIRRPCVVISQGGNAPIAVRLASRASEAVAGLVFVSPPEWREIAAGLPSEEVESNYRQLSFVLGSPSQFGTACYRAISSRPVVRFFSDAFLFADKADDTFIEACCATTTPERRWPVIAFNAGMVRQKGLEAELLELPQPTLVLIGEDGGKPKENNGQDYRRYMRRAVVQKLKGLNVLPWESAGETSEAVRRFVEVEIFDPFDLSEPFPR